MFTMKLHLKYSKHSMLTVKKEQTVLYSMYFFYLWKSTVQEYAEVRKFIGKRGKEFFLILNVPFEKKYVLDINAKNFTGKISFKLSRGTYNFRKEIPRINTLTFPSLIINPKIKLINMYWTCRQNISRIFRETFRFKSRLHLY